MGLQEPLTCSATLVNSCISAVIQSQIADLSL